MKKILPMLLILPLVLSTAVPEKGGSYDNNPDNWNLKDYVYMDNVYCAVYREEIAGYMAGYAAYKRHNKTVQPFC